MTASVNKDQPDQDKPAPGTTMQGNLNVHNEEVHGDKILQDKVLGDKITQYIFQGLADAAARYKQFTELDKQPYLPDRPFTPIERPLFTGREEEIREILRFLGDEGRQTIVIYGPPDVGKTSLIAAGIIPGLAIVGAVPLLLQEYNNPISNLQREILTQAALLGIALDDHSPSALVQQLVNSTGQGVVLILDQFERAFLSAAAAAKLEDLRQELRQMVGQIPRRYFHLLIAIRDDLSFELDPPWRDLLPDLGQSVIYLEGLEIDEARKAIEMPVNLAREDPTLFPPFYYDRDGAVINDLILPDLDDLSNQDQQLILPADLQIVCYRLYEAAQKKEIPTIDPQLYWQVSHDKGAAFIIDNHFQTLLNKLPETSRELAKTVSQAMLEEFQNFWSTPESVLHQLNFPESWQTSGPAATFSLADIQIVMDEMVRAGILISHESAQGWSYAFASNSLANAAGRAAGPEYEKKLEARKQVNAIWNAWVYYDSLAEKRQLRLVEQYSLDHDPLHALLYLRSAVAQDLPVKPWLARLATADARQLLRRIEESHLEDSAQTGAQARRHRAENVLGLLDQEVPKIPENTNPLTWTAAAHPKSSVRQTAVLALLASYNAEDSDGRQQRDALDRVESLWEDDLIDRPRFAELVGTLANADSKIAGRNKKRPVNDRFAIWRWRFRNLFIQDRRFILVLTLGGALGLGLGLGLLRALISLIIPYRSGDALFFYTPEGFFLGAGVTFGVLITNTIRLRGSNLQDKENQKRPLLLTLFLGGFCFLLMHLFLGLILSVGLLAAPLAHLLSFVAGAALAWVIVDQPMAGWTGRRGVLFLRLFTTALIFVLIQIIFIRFDPQGYSLQFAWNGAFYNQQLSGIFEQARMNITGWPPYFAVIDAALSGLFMAAGLAIGLFLANRWNQNWLALKIRAGE